MKKYFGQFIQVYLELFSYFGKLKTKEITNWNGFDPQQHSLGDQLLFL